MPIAHGNWHRRTVRAENVGARRLELWLAVVASERVVVVKRLRDVYGDSLLQVGHAFQGACCPVKRHRNKLQKQSV